MQPSLTLSFFSPLLVPLSNNLPHPRSLFVPVFSIAKTLSGPDALVFENFHTRIACSAVTSRGIVAHETIAEHVQLRDYMDS